MARTCSRPERIDLARADDPRDVIHRAVACLAQGGVVGLPTDTSYALAASGLCADAVVRLARVGGAEAEGPLLLLVRSAEELPDWVPGVALVARRLARRSWPGPLTLLCEGAIERGLVRRLPDPVRALVVGDAGIGLRCPEHPVVLNILNWLVGPLLLCGAETPGAAPRYDAESLAGRDGIELVIDDGPLRAPASSTLVRVTADAWQVVRPGQISSEELARRAATELLFVCTGNTCRSPMAEALCRALLAQRLGCAVTAVEGRGFRVHSAGVAAMEGMPASPHAVEAVRGRGGCLADHVSRRVTPELVRSADLILTMTREHLDTLLEVFPQAAGRVRPLHARGGDIPDPYGGDPATYRRTADAIAEYLARLLDELRVGASS